MREPAEFKVIQYKVKDLGGYSKAICSRFAFIKTSETKSWAKKEPKVGPGLLEKTSDKNINNQ